MWTLLNSPEGRLEHLRGRGWARAVPTARQGPAHGSHRGVRLVIRHYTHPFLTSRTAPGGVNISLSLKVLNVSRSRA